jgi:hypothetical protein
MRLVPALGLVPVVALVHHEPRVVEAQDRDAGDRRFPAARVLHHRPVLDGGAVGVDRERLAEPDVRAGLLVVERPLRVGAGLLRVAERRRAEVRSLGVERPYAGGVVRTPGGGPLVRPPPRRV